MTQQEALQEARRRGGNTAEFIPESTVNIPYYRVSKKNMIGFEWEGTGDSWEAAFADADQRERAL